MGLLKKKDPAREALREALTRKAEMETRLDRLRAGRNDANDRLGKSVMALKKAEEAFDAAYQNLARETVDAISAGRPAPAGPDADSLRRAVGAAEAERRGHEATVKHISEEISALEDKLSCLPLDIDRAIGDICEPKVRATLDALYAAQSAELQAKAVLRHLFDKKYIPDTMGAEVARALGLAFGYLAGDPLSPVKAPDLSRLTDAMAALRSDADAELPKD